MENLIGKNLGQYEITEKIGEGGMAQVYKAFQASLDRFVAIKVLSPLLAREPGFTERFQREARAIARLNHPHILKVYDTGIQDSYNYLVMHLVPGSITLNTLMDQHASKAQLFEYIIQVADALNYAHQQGIIHRDIKPGNILIDGKWALLSDFGLVKDSSSVRELTSTGVGMGTPAYMSPEQAKGDKVDHRTDIYALGIILHKILTDTIPHEAPTPLAIMLKRTTEPVASLRQTNPDVSRSLEYVTLRALATNREQRYNSTLQFAEDLKKAKDDPDYRAEATLASTLVTERTPTSSYETGGKTAQLDHRTVTLTGEPAPPKRKNIGLMLAGGAAVAVILVLLLFALPALTRSSDEGAAAPAAVVDTPTETGQTGAGAGADPPTEPPLPPPEPPTAVPPGAPRVTTNVEVEVWAGPGDAYELLGYLPDGSVAEIAGRDRAGEWWQIKTSLSPRGLGWVKAGAEFTTVEGGDNLPIALAPPTATPSPTPTIEVPTSTPTATPEPTATPTPPPIPTRSPPPVRPQPPPPTRPPPSPTRPEGEFTLLRPVSLDNPTFGQTDFRWRWTGPLADDQGFEVRVWREGEPPAGVHNAVLDNRDGTVRALGNNTYQLVADISQAPGVRNRRGEYNWTVVLVQVTPEYQDLGLQAPPGRLRFEPPGPSGGGDDGGNDEGGLKGGD